MPEPRTDLDTLERMGRALAINYNAVAGDLMVAAAAELRSLRGLRSTVLAEISHLESIDLTEFGQGGLDHLRDVLTKAGVAIPAAPSLPGEDE